MGKLWKQCQTLFWGAPKSLQMKTVVINRHGTKDWIKIGKGVRQGCILSPCYLTYMQSTLCKIPGWDEAQDGIKIAGRTYQ